MSRDESALPAKGSAIVSGSRRWFILFVVGLAVLLSMTSWFSATALVPELVEHWSLSASTASWLTNAVQIGFVAGALAASFFNLPDILSLRRLMTGAALMAAGMNSVLLIAPDATVAIVARLATGIALAGVYPPAMKLIATWFVKDRGLALASLIAALTIGSAFPHLSRSLTEGYPWQAVVVSSSIATLLGAALIALYAVEGPYPFSRAVFDPRQLGRIFRSRGVVLASVGYFGHMWELYAMWSWFVVYADVYLSGVPGSLRLDPSLVTFAVVAVGALGCIVGGLMADRIGRTAVAMAMMMMSAACAATIGLTFGLPIWAFLLVSLLWGFSIIGDSAQFSAMVTELSDPRLVGTSLAVQMGLGFGLTVISIWMIPLIADDLGWQWTFLWLVPGPLIGTLAIYMLRRLPEAQNLANGRR